MIGYYVSPVTRVGRVSGEVIKESWTLTLACGYF